MFVKKFHPAECIAVHELSCVEKKNSAENNTVRRYSADSNYNKSKDVGTHCTVVSTCMRLSVLLPRIVGYNGVRVVALSANALNTPSMNCPRHLR